MHDRNRLIEAEIPSLRRYARVLMRDADRADDLVQDCVERAISRWSQWQRRGALRAWLFAILHNIHANRARRYGRKLALERSQLVGLDDAVPPAQGDAVALRDLSFALDQLPDGQRETVLLVGLEGFSYAEVAQMLDVPIGTVMSRLARGRERLRLMVDGEPGRSLRRVK